MSTYYKIKSVEMEKAHMWADNIVCNPPFGFLYGGEDIRPLLKKHVPQIRKYTDGKYEWRTVIWELSRLTVRCEIELSMQYPEVEWTVWLENPYDNDTDLITDFYAIDDYVAPDMVFPHPGINHPVTFTHFNGDSYSLDGYAQIDRSLPNGIPLVFRNVGGRSTSTQFPYYQIGSDNRRVIAAVSWQGQWETVFCMDWEKGVHMRAGQQYFNAYIRKGEKIRSPLIALMFFDDPDYNRAMNLWRAWSRERNMPAIGMPMTSGGTNSLFENARKATEENQLLFINKYLENGIKLDYWWLDAQWYDYGPEPYWNWCHTGLKMDYTRFPSGFVPLAEKLEEYGGKVLAWFEPERATPGTELYENHKDWLLTVPEALAQVREPHEKIVCKEPDDLLGNLMDTVITIADENTNIDNSLLVNLGLDEVVDWLTKRISGIIQENKISIYRQDGNMSTLRFWRHNDEPGREGILENKYCRGHLKLWDNLLSANPGLIIDTCASGGRRLDLETVRRSICLCPTDLILSPLPVTLASFNQTLAQWIPYYSLSFHHGDSPSAYTLAVSFSAWFSFDADIFNEAVDFTTIKAFLAAREDLVPFLKGDFIPLLPYSRDSQNWLLWQYDRSDLGEGIIFAIAHEGSLYRSIVARPLNIAPDFDYEIRTNEGFVFDAPVRISGKQLLEEGILIEINEFPKAVIIRYKRLSL